MARRRVVQGGTDIKVTGNCTFCGAATTEQMWCKGCRSFVCFLCDETGVWDNKHRQGEHRFTQAERYAPCPQCGEPVDRGVRKCSKCETKF